MAAVLAYLQANWAQIGVILLLVDQALIGIFPQVALFGSLKGIIQSLFGGAPPQVPPAA